jgi:hypothetical protein
VSEVLEVAAKQPEPQRIKGLVGSTLTQDVENLWADIERYDLHRNIAELEVRGVTVVPPEKMDDRGLYLEIIEAIMKTYERRFGSRPDIDAYDPKLASQDPVHHTLSYVLLEDEAFYKAVMNPVSRILATHLLGKNLRLSSCQALVKQAGGVDLELHTDSLFIPPPHPVQEQHCNVTWALTDYTPENGPLCYVPGSHKYKRDPILGEGVEDRVPVYARAGSIIVWGGEIWHGSFARKAPGLRLSLVTGYSRSHLALPEIYRDEVPPEMVEKYGPEFAKLIGQDLFFPWKEKRRPMTSLYGRHAYE